MKPKNLNDLLKTMNPKFDKYPDYEAKMGEQFGKPAITIYRSKNATEHQEFAGVLVGYIQPYEDNYGIVSETAIF